MDRSGVDGEACEPQQARSGRAWLNLVRQIAALAPYGADVERLTDSRKPGGHVVLIPLDEAARSWVVDSTPPEADA